MESAPQNTQEQPAATSANDDNAPVRFVNLEEDTPSEEITSLCMSCREMGVTRFLFTKIPFFKEIIVSSFGCEHCGYRNNEVQFGGQIADFGVRYELKVINQVHMNRNVVKSEHATIRIPELDLEIPAETQKGCINTLEGFLQKTTEGLQELQEERKKYDPTTAAKIDEFIQKVTEYQEGRRFPFTFILEDPSGNSFIQNPNAPNKDVYMKTTYYPRTPQDYATMGYNEDASKQQAEIDAANFQKANPNETKLEQAIKDAKAGIKIKGPKGQTKEDQEALLEKFRAYANRDPEITASNVDFSRPIDSQEENKDDGDVKKEALKFPTSCYACGREGMANMCIASIPFFKEIIIMAFCCDFCGYRNSDIKHGGGMSEHGTKIVFQVNSLEDMNRDLFKSDSCTLELPEIDFEMAPGSLDSMYTTVEGLLQKVYDALTANNPFGVGDSSENNKYVTFLQGLKDLQEFKRGPFQVVLDDALSNCFIYNPHAPEPDPQVTVTVYERTWEQNEELGINDMNV